MGNEKKIKERKDNNHRSALTEWDCVYIDKQKAEISADTVELNCSENNHPDENDDHTENIESTVH